MRGNDRAERNNMKRKEIEKKKVELDEILKEPDENDRLNKLKALAKEVGASVTRMGKILVKHDTYGGQQYREENQITESEIVHNIQFALQTETMINECKIASRNFWIAVGATLVAFLATLAAWTRVALDWWCGR